MTNVRYSGSSQRGPSSFWGELEPWRGIDPNFGWGHWEDFHYLMASATNNTREEADDKAAWSVITTEECGVLRCAITGDDNEQGNWGFGGTTTAPLVMSSSTGRMWFEARVRFSSVTDNVLSMILGLAEEGSVAADMLADDSADISDKDYIAFAVWADDGDALDAIYQTSGSAFGTALASCGALVAATWIKLGLYFDGRDTCTWYVDGVSVKTLSVSTTGFPDGEELNPVFSVKVSSDAALNADMDWFAFAQEAV